MAYDVELRKGADSDALSSRDQKYCVKNIPVVTYYSITNQLKPPLNECYVVNKELLVGLIWFFGIVCT